MVPDLSPPMSMGKIQLKLKQKINIRGHLVSGCSLLPDGRMVLSCYITDTVTFINKEGVELFQIGKDKTGPSTYDTVYIKDKNSVAVSSGPVGNRCITIIDIESQKIMTTITIDDVTLGMAVRGKTIYYCTGNMLNLTDKSVCDINSSNKSNITYVVTSGNKLYYRGCKPHTVTLYDLYGTTQWEFKDEWVLKGPCGISVDNDGNVYVVGNSSNNVVVISPDGQRYRELLSSMDGLLHPVVLEYDKSTNRLLVVSESKSAFLFDVTRGQ
jgi:DNA-binding beta-propeller fold protein YncE